MLEPVLLLVAEAIRKGPNLGNFLREGSVAAYAMMYRHRASPKDHDWVPLQKIQKIDSTKDTFGSRNPSYNGFRKQTQRYKYKVGWLLFPVPKYRQL